VTVVCWKGEQESVAVLGSLVVVDLGQSTDYRLGIPTYRPVAGWK
jgi:hypothetical protein